MRTRVARLVSCWAFLCTRVLSDAQLETLYDVLGIFRNATKHEIQRAYRRAALLEHPDKSERPDAETRFRRVAEAFEVLRDDTSRAQYDYDLKHNGASSSSHGRGAGMTSADAYELFKNHVGDVYQHWKPGFRVEGDVLRNHERIRIVLYPDGSSHIEESANTMMHHFRRIGVGWCVFHSQTRKMTGSGIFEGDCRQKCVDMRPDCAGYAYDKGSRHCQVYKRTDPPEAIESTDLSLGVFCYEQDDAAFDMSSDILKSEVRITAPDGLQTGVVTEVFCQSQAPQHHAIGPGSRRDDASLTQSFKRVAGVITSIASNPLQLLDSSLDSWLQAARRVGVAFATVASDPSILLKS